MHLKHGCGGEACAFSLVAENLPYTIAGRQPLIAQFTERIPRELNVAAETKRSTQGKCHRGIQVSVPALNIRGIACREPATRT